MLPATHKRKCTQSKTINPRATATQTTSRIAPPSQTPALHPSKLETNNNHPPSIPRSLPALPIIAHVASPATSRPSPQLLRHSFNQIKNSILLYCTILRAPSLALSRVDYRIDLQTL
ncbi:hypothetical protein NA56DRAFT_461069 [Hyaloscypha hepaticicola]|uniref:Uncharacterized protein n=1 Tax=Hyaloscypha hepaticicola TaxID=2082293 RepID=A0A2J6QF59_9HELO|nr:hypothetical protein NA56DRAFT_461069 [Hyaloscypha hepaticicola]